MPHTASPNTDVSVSEPQKVALKNTMVSLLPNAFETIHLGHEIQPLKATRTISGQQNPFDADEPTLKESNAQAYRADMVADSAGTDAICEQLQFLLDPNDHNPSTTDLDDGFIPRHHSITDDSTKTADIEVPLVKHVNMFSKSTSDLFADEQRPISGLHKTNSAPAPGEANDLEVQENSSHLTVPSPRRKNSKRAVPPNPELPSTEPSLYLQAADATGAAWYGEDETCRPLTNDVRKPADRTSNL